MEGGIGKRREWNGNGVKGGSIEVIGGSIEVELLCLEHFFTLLIERKKKKKRATQARFTEIT